LTALWQQVLDVQEIGIHDNFFDLGGHSLKAAQLFYQLELVFGKQLPLATLFQAPTVAELAAILVKENWTPPWQSLVAIQPAGSATPLFMVPGVGGNVLVFAKLATLLGHEQPVYGLQARGLDGKESPFTSVPEMAAHYVRQIKGAYPTGPYMIAGVCTGGLIAYEMGQQLLAQGDRATLFLLDTWHPDSYSRYKNMWWGRVFMAGVIVEKTWTDLRMVLRMPVKVWWPNIKRKGRVLISLLSQSVNEEIQDQDFRVQRLTQATFLAVSRYRVKAFAGKVVNVIAAQRRVNEVNVDTRHRWIHLADKHSVTVEIPAEDSGRLFVSPYVEELAGHLQRHLRPETHSATARGRREIDDVSA
jgi:thioesterase domain-containing protein/acyl carrier protein